MNCKMNRKNIVIVFMSLAFISFKMPRSEMRKNNMNIEKKQRIDGAKHYQKNYKKFKYYIETIGVVFINNVELKNGELTAFYSYKQGNEVRNVTSVLRLDNDGIYKGTCTTKVNGKVTITVNTWLTFTEDGTASGNWSWSGKPSNNDPKVKISKL